MREEGVKEKDVGEEDDGERKGYLDDDEEKENTPPSSTGDDPDNWAYILFKLQMNLEVQFNTINGNGVIMSVEIIDLHNAGSSPLASDRPVSDVSCCAYTAGSSMAASGASTARQTPKESTSTLHSQFETQMLSIQRLEHLKNRFVNHEMLYNTVDYIDRLIQVPEHSEDYSQPMEVGAMEASPVEITLATEDSTTELNLSQASLLGTTSLIKQHQKVPPLELVEGCDEEKKT